MAVAAAMSLPSLTPAPPPTSAEAEQPALRDPGLTWRSLLISLIATVLAGVWVKQAEIVVLATQSARRCRRFPAWRR